MTDVTPSPATTLRSRNWITALLLILAAWLLYLPSLHYGFVYYDDVRILLNHPELYGEPSLSADLKAIFITYFPREEPLLLRDVSWALDSQVFGFGNPFGYHLVNVLLHGVVVALMFCFLLGTTRRYAFALAVSVAWLVVAVHTEPVAWIMGRKDILSTLFMLLALCAQVRRLTAQNGPARCGWYLATVLCFVAGLLSKISVVTFPAVLFLHAVLFPYLNGERSPAAPFVVRRNLWLELALFVPALAVSGWVYLWYGHTLGQTGLLDRGYSAHGLAHLWNLLMIDPLVIWVYLQQTFCPWHLKVLYTWPDLKTAYPAWQILVSLGTIAMIGLAGLWLFFRRKDLFFYFTAFFLLMVPYLNLKYIGIWVAERYLYFSVFCVLAVAISSAEIFWRSPRKWVRTATLAVVAGIAAWNLFQTCAYVPAWRNAATLWEYHIALPHPTPAAYGNLAAYYYAQATAQQGTPEMTVSMRKVSIVVDAGLKQFWPDRNQSPPPETYFLFFLQSLLQEVQGEPEKALASLLTSDQLHPRFDSTDLNLSRLYHQLAGTTTNSVQRQEYARAAHDRLAEYIALDYRGTPAPLDLQKELADLQADCLTTNQPDLKPAPAP
jgi:hypothetical protein